VVVSRDAVCGGMQSRLLASPRGKFPNKLHALQTTGYCVWQANRACTYIDVVGDRHENSGIRSAEALSHSLKVDAIDENGRRRRGRRSARENGR
jgi:hypothetical protein